MGPLCPTVSINKVKGAWLLCPTALMNKVKGVMDSGEGAGPLCFTVSINKVKRRGLSLIASINKIKEAVMG